MTTLNITVPRPVREPRGASWLAEGAIALLNAIRGFGNPFRRVGVPVSDVAAMRDVARSYETSDPSLAAELYAVADRYDAARGL